MEAEAEDSTISSEFKLSELKLPTFRDKLNQLHDEASSILLLSGQLKEAEDQFGTATNLIEAKANELHSIQYSIRQRMKQAERKDKELEGVKDLVNERLSKIEVREKEIEAKTRELEGIQEAVNERFGEIAVKEKGIELKEKEIEGVEELLKEQGKETELKRKELEAIQEFVNEKFREMEEREKGIELKRKELEGLGELVKKRTREIELKERELEGIEMSVKEKFWEIDLRETEIELKRKELERDGELVKKRVEGIEVSLKERFSKIEVKERGIQLKENELERLLETVKEKLIEVDKKEMESEGIKESVKGRIGEIEVKEKELEGIKESVKGRIGEIEVKEKEYEKLLSELKVKEVKVQEKSKELKLKDQRVGKRFREFLAKEKKFKDECEELKLKDENVLERLKEIESKEKEIHDRCKVLDLNEKKFEERCKEFRLRELKVEGQSEVLKLKENQLEERWKEAEFERKRIMDQYKELELTREFEEHGRDFGFKDKIFVNTKVNMEPKETYIVEKATNSMDANLCSSMDGKALQTFLNEHCKGHECKSEVEIALRISSDPAMLVLNALEGFYPPHLRKGDVEFDEGVVRNSCILLIEKLMKISPEIRPHVKKEAMKIASDWMKKMRLDAAHSLEVLGFLQLLASYGLASDFSSDKLLKYLEFISEHSQAPDLFRVLGFGDKISGFIQNLIRKKRRVEAVRFIYAFDLENKFPPGPLLKDHLNDSKITAKRMNKRDKSLETQIETANKRIADVRAALKCIEDHKIESQLSVKQLREQIGLWEKENLRRKQMLPDPGHKSEPLNTNEMKFSIYKAAAIAATPNIEPKSACATNTNSRFSTSTAASTAMPTEITAPSLTAAPISATSPNTAAAHIPPTTITSPSPTVSPIKTALPTTTTETTLLAIVSSPSPTIAPPSFTPKVEPKQQERNELLQTQNQRGKKRPRVCETSKIPRKASFREPDNVYPVQPPGQQPAGWFTNQGAPYLDSARHYSLNGYTSINLQLSPYYYYMPMSSRRY